MTMLLMKMRNMMRIELKSTIDDDNDDNGDNDENDDNDDNDDNDGDDVDDETDQHWLISLLLRVFPKRKVMYWIVTSSPAAMST